MRASRRAGFYRGADVLSWFLLAFLLPRAVRHASAASRSCCFDVLERRFVLFGIVFWPQDFYLVVLIALAASGHAGAVDDGGRTGLVRLVVPADHLHGDAVPEDRIPDRWVGRRTAAPRRGPGDAGRCWCRRVLKHGIFFALSFLIANVFLAYIIGADALWRSSRTRPRAHLAGLIAIVHLQPRLLRGVRAVPRAGLHARLSRTAA